MARRWALALVALTVAASLTPDGTAAPNEPTLSFLQVEPAATAGGLPRIVDELHREVLLRGVNVNGLEDYYQDSPHPLDVVYPTTRAAYSHGRCPRASTAIQTAPLCEFDATQIRRYGYNVVRLALSWSLLEPQSGQISAAYLDRITQVVGWFRDQHIRVVLDIHQDAWSKYIYTPKGTTCPPGFSTIGGYHEADGAPEWASRTKLPACAFQGIREIDAAVAERFNALYANLPAPDGVGLRDHYAAVLAAMAKRFVADPTVAGYDLMNEPQPGFTPVVTGAVLVFQFQAALVDAMRAAAPGFRQLVFLEPDAIRNVTDLGGHVLPWSAFNSYPNAVYAPHVYTGVFTYDAIVGGILGTPRFVKAHDSYTKARRDAVLLGLPLWVGEFGTSISADSTLLTDHYTEQDANGIGGVLWVWKQYRRGDFSVMHEPFGQGTAYPSRVVVTDRVYPQATNGRIVRLSYVPTTGRFHLSVTGAHENGAATALHIPSRITAPLLLTAARAETTREPSGARRVLIFPTAPDYVVDLAN